MKNQPKWPAVKWAWNELKYYVYATVVAIMLVFLAAYIATIA